MATLTLTFDNLGEATALQRGTWTPASELGRDPSVLVALPRLLDELDGHGLRATFCVEAINCELYPAALREIADRGHEIAAHGWRHEPWIELHPEQASELLRRDRHVFAELGIPVEGFRPPGGALAAGDAQRLVDAGFRWCSPQLTDVPAAPQPPLAWVPFDWDLVDAYLLMDRFAPLRVRRGDREAALDPEATAARLRGRLWDPRGPRTFVLHPFLMLDAAWWPQVRALLETIAAAVAGGTLRCVTAGEAALSGGRRP